MVWNDRMIENWAKVGNVEPFDSKMVAPSSLDMKWSGRYKVFTRKGWSDVYTTKDYIHLHKDTWFNRMVSAWRRWRGDYSYAVGLVLLDTQEYIRMPHNASGTLQLKSSQGRAGLEHSHAGFVEPDFHGTLTLEMENRVILPYKLIKHEPLVQLVLEEAHVPVKSYLDVGRYNGQGVPTESKD